MLKTCGNCGQELVFVFNESLTVTTVTASLQTSGWQNGGRYDNEAVVFVLGSQVLGWTCIITLLCSLPTVGGWGDKQLSFVSSCAVATSALR